MKKPKLLSVLVLTLILCTIIPLSGCDMREVLTVKKGLTSFCYSSGGGMRGESDFTEIRKMDATSALVSCVSKNAYYAQEEVKEYLVDLKVLQDIEEVFKKYHMGLWNNKKFTRMFVSDGASKSYSFSFENGSVRFSSQIYPAGYSKKLNQIHAVIADALKDAELMPGLVTAVLSDEEQSKRYYPVDGLIQIYPNAYFQGKLYFTLSNGTEEAVSFTDTCSIVNTETGEAVPVQDGDKYFSVSARATAECLVKIGRIPAGKYRLTVHSMSFDFEIK